MNAPTVTVLTAVRNGQTYLPETIESIRSQTFEDWEYIIVDDASEDGTATIVEGAAARDARILLVRRAERGGPYLAANDGLRRARGRYVARLDADDLSHPRRLECQVRFLDADPSLRACATRSQRIIGETLGPPDDPPPETSRLLRWYLPLVSGLRHSSACVERAAFEDLGLYRPYPAGADFALWCELARRGWVGVVPEILVYKRLHPGQMRGTPTEAHLRRRVELTAEHLQALTGDPWSEDDAAALLRAVGGEEPSVASGMRALARWERAWRADRELTPEDRRFLARLATRRRLRHLRRSGPAQPLAAAAALAETAARAVRP